MTKPKLLLRVEGGLFCLPLRRFHQAHGSWFWFGLLFLTPDFSMLGYLANNRLGAYLYNLAHT